MENEELLGLPGVEQMDFFTPNEGEVVAPATEVEETQEMVEEVEAAEPAPQEVQPEDNRTFFQQATDQLAETLGIRSQEESIASREKWQQKEEELNQQIDEAQDIGTVVAREGVRAVAGGVAGVVEQPVRFIQQVTGQEASFNLGIAENKTAIGNFARTAITMMGLMKGAAVAGVKVGAGASVSSRLATEAARGAIADFILEEGDGNMSNMLEDMSPGLRDTFLTALAHDDDDNVWIRKLKNTAEGGIFGLAVDGIGEFIQILRAGRKVRKQGREAVIKAMEEKQLELQLGSTRAKQPKKLGAHDVFTEASDGDYSRLNQLDAYELKSLMQDYNLAQFSSPRDILQNVDPFTSYKALGEGIWNKKLPNGTNIEWSLRDVSEQFPEGVGHPLEGRGVHRIDWDLSDADADAGGLGREATQMFRQFSEVTSDTLKPGDIMMTEAAEDGFGVKGASGAQKAAKAKNYDDQLEQAKKVFLETEEGATEDAWRVIGERERGRRLAQYKEQGLVKAPAGVRQKLYERAGFSTPDAEGKMYGVILKDKNGRARLQPLDLTKDIDEQVEAARAGSAVQESLDLDSADLDRITKEKIATTPETAAAYNRVEAMRKGGIQPKWEDVAEVTPEMFEPGARAVQPDFSEATYKAINEMDGGVTVDPFTGEIPSSGSMVAIDGAVLDDVTPAKVQEFIADNYDILTREDVYLGGWISDITGKPVVELSRRVEDADAALALGRLYDQEGVFRMDDFQYVPTGGSDRLRATKGGQAPVRDGVHDPGYDARVRESFDNNADSIDTNLFEPNDRAAVSSGYTPGEAVESMITASREGVPGGAKRVLNEDTIKAIAGAQNPEEALSKAIRAVEGDGSSMDALYARLREARGEKFEAQARELARALDMDEDGLKNYLNELVPDGEGGQIKRFMSDDGALTVRILQKDTANQIYDIASTAKELDEAGADSYQQATMLLDRLAVLDEMNIKHSYKSGAGLASRKNSWLNVGKEFDGEGAAARKKSQEFIAEMREALEKGDSAAAKEFTTLVDALKVAEGNPAKVEKFWGLFKKGLGGNLKAALYNGMLSTTTSQVRNFTGNMFNVVLRPATQAVGFAVQGDISAARIQMAAYSGLVENISESFEVLKRSWDASGENSQVLRFDSGSAAKGREIVEAAKASAETAGERAAAEFLSLQYDMFQNPWVRMPTRGLTAVDDAVRTLVARMELKKRAMESSWEKGQGFKVDEDRYAKLVDIYLNKDGAIMDQALLDNAKDVTFQTDLQGFGADLTAMIDKNPALRLTMPFVKTPINIMRTTFSYTPFVSQFLNQFNKVMKNGDEATKALYRGREATGYMVTTAAAGLALNGMITGNGPRDPEKKKIWLEYNQPNSIKTPWGWVSYETLEPLNTIFSMTADLVQTLKANNTSAYDQGWAQIAYTISSAVFDKSYFKGITDTVTLMNPNDPQWERLAMGVIGNTINSVVLPNSGLRNQLGKAMAPGKAEFDSWLDRALATSIPGMRSVVGVDRESIFKEPTLDTGGYINHLWNTITPFDVKGTAHNGLAQKLGELGVDITTEFSDTFKGIELNATERNMLNRYLRESGIGDNLDRLMNKEWFVKDVEAWKDANLPGDFKPKWQRAIAREMNRAKRAAKARMLRENPTFAQKVNLSDKVNKALTRGNMGAAARLQTELETLIDL